MKNYSKQVFVTIVTVLGIDAISKVYHNYGAVFTIIPAIATLVALYIILKGEKKTNTETFAKHELDILEKTVPDAVVLEFRDEILALCQAFGESGQSGGSAPYTASVLSQTIQKLCLIEPICPITGIEEEWYKPIDRESFFQNNRCSGVFKDSDDIRAYYLDAIIFKGEEDHDTFTGNVQDITSRQYIKSFPFEPKSFYIDVVRVSYNEELHENHYEHRDGSRYVYEIKDRQQLVEVFQYYDKLEKLATNH